MRTRLGSTSLGSTRLASRRAGRVRRACVPLGLALVLAATGCAQPAPTVSSGSSAPSTGSVSAGGPPPSGSAPAGSSAGTAAGASTPVSAPAPPSAPTATSGPSPAPVTSGPGRPASPLPACRDLRTLRAGHITLAAADRAASPWFTGDPADGQGYEAAVGAAVARELGYSAGNVVWTTADRSQVLAGRASGFDVALGEFPVPDRAATAVDYSTGYFSISQSVVARTGSPAATLKASATLRTLRVATAGVPTGGEAAGGAVAAAVSYPTTTAALAALTAGKVDAALIPTPEAVTVGKGFVVVGQLSSPTEQPPQFGMVLPHRSALTSCVSAAIDQLRVTGVLAALVAKWVPAAARPLR